MCLGFTFVYKIKNNRFLLWITFNKPRGASLLVEKVFFNVG